MPPSDAGAAQGSGKWNKAECWDLKIKTVKHKQDISSVHLYSVLFLTRVSISVSLHFFIDSNFYAHKANLSVKAHSSQMQLDQGAIV